MFNFFKKKSKKKADWLVVGLGNPGVKYKETRHNIGWMIGNALATKHKAPFKESSSIYHASSFIISGSIVLTAIPTTYMNNSGEAVKKLLQEFDVPITNLIIILDEYNFQVGKIHLKDSGNDGGHNGMMSVLQHIGNQPFFRLRCGISKNFGPGGLVDYVLSNFKPEEESELELMINHAVISIEHLINSDNSNRAMSEINSGKLWKLPGITL
jgi:PTH1 family peptidyl-tRNA hydrolase